MKVYKGRRHTIALILYLGTRWRRMVNLTPLRLFYPRGRTPVPNEQETGWALQPEWPFGSYRDSKPELSSQHPSRYTDFANPESCDLAAALKFKLVTIMVI